MDTAEFLQAVVTSKAGYFNLATRPPDGQWRDEWFVWPDDLDKVVNRATVAAPENNVYFSAHLFEERNSAKRFVMASRTIQADLDYAIIGSIKPNILVETSPDRHQGYWLLTELLPPDSLEVLSRQLTYKITDADRSGWSLGHKMRLPGTLNHKYPGRPKQIKIVSVSLADVRLRFDSEEPEEAEWVPAELDGSVRDLWAKLRRSLSRQANTYFEVRQQDRSAALWHLMNALFRAGLDKDQVFWIAKASRNNKFADNRYHADRDLAKDVIRAQRSTMVTGEEGSPREVIDAFRTMQGVTAKQKKDAIAYRVRDFMQQAGILVRTDSGQDFFVREDNGQPIEISPRSETFKSYLDMRYGLNATENEYRYVVAYLQAFTNEHGRRVKLGNYSYYDKRNETVFVHGGRRDVYKVDRTGTHLAINGEYDLIWPWKASDVFEPDFAHPIRVERMFDGAFDNLVESTPVQANALLHAWMVFLLLRDDAISRPILALFGQPGSGKSTLFRRIYTLLYGARRSVNTITKPDDYDHAVANDPFVVFDGVDTFNPWLPDKLSTSAAPSDLTKRKLFTDTDSVILRREALVGVTAHNPQFRREDIVDRLLMMNFHRLPDFKPDGPIINRVATMRNGLWAGLLQDVQKVLATPDPPEADLPNFRINDFARLGLRAARTLGFEPAFRSALELNNAEQTTFNIAEEDVLIDTIERYVARYNDGAYHSVNELWSEWSTIARDPQTFGRLYKNAVQLGRKLWAMNDSLKAVFIVDIQYDKASRREWRFQKR